MRPLRTRVMHWPIILAAAFGLFLATAIRAAATPQDAAAQLELTESLRTADHAQFLRLLQQLHLDASGLTAAEQWHLRYLDAWRAAFEVDYPKADSLLREVIAGASDPALLAKAHALRMDVMGVTGRYEEAFVVANRLISELPGITDKLARFLVLSDLSQLFASSGQYDLALRYADQMEDSIPPGETLCIPRKMRVTALFNAGKLTSASPEIQQTIDLCLAAGQPVYVDIIWQILADIYVHERQPEKALALLHRIAPDIQANAYTLNVRESQVLSAQAYWQLADYKNAQKSALATVAMSSRGEISVQLRDAYQLLYLLAKKQGDTEAALGFYERYVTQDKGYLNDVSAKALAFETVQHQVLDRKLEAEELSKQNNLLRLRQALDTKAAETSRLYIILLIMTLAFIVLWLYRLKRSQLRFKKLSCLDGLTGIFNHQHFVSQAECSLRTEKKKLGHVCLISLDLDHFKQVNDTHGHAVGDAVLKHTVAVCRQQLRPVDLFGRLGGEEFGILLHDCSSAQGIETANRIRIAIAETPMKHDGGIVVISTSVGVACSDISGYSLSQLCTDADAALYGAKRAGRNRVVVDIGSGKMLEA